MIAWSGTCNISVQMTQLWPETADMRVLQYNARIARSVTCNMNADETHLA